MLGLTDEQWVAMLIGTLMQILFIQEWTAIRIGIVLVSSIFVGLYVVKPAMAILEVKQEMIPGVFAVTAVISKTLIDMFIKVLPAVFQVKAMKMLGIDYEDYRKAKSDLQKGDDDESDELKKK